MVAFARQQKMLLPHPSVHQLLLRDARGERYLQLLT
jgi:hypothetical protein